VPGFWDSPDVKAAATNAEYASLKVVGDEAQGTIAKLSVRKFNEGKADERPAIEIKFTDAPTLTAGQTMLMQGLYELQPTPGDHLYVKLIEVQKMGAKTMKRFLIRVSQPSGQILEIDQSQAADSPGIKIVADAKPTNGSAAKEPVTPAGEDAGDPPF
jgi:hypothetical protein